MADNYSNETLSYYYHKYSADNSELIVQRESSFKQDDNIININHIKNENKELKDMNSRLLEKIIEMERKIKILHIKLDKDDALMIINNKTLESDKIKQKVEASIVDRNITNKKLEKLECELANKIKIMPDNPKIGENELFRYFNENVLKKIKKREEEHAKHQILLEKILIFSKKLKKLIF